MNPGRLVFIYDESDGTYKNMQCDQAYTHLTSQITQNVSDGLIPMLGASLNPTASLANASTLVAAQLPVTDDYILGISTTAADSIRQAATINLLNDSQEFVPQMLGDSASATTALSTAIASASANSSYLTMAKLAEGTLPIVRNAINALTLAIFPIIILLIIMAGSRGGEVLATYLMALLWVQLWAPLYAVINYFMTWWAQHGARAAGATSDPLSFMAHQGVAHSLVSEQAIAGILVISVPVIAFMLVKSSAASFTSVIGGVMSPATSAAQSAGSQVGQGNTNVGNTSWGNVSMGNWGWNNRTGDQWNTAPSMAWGSAVSRQMGRDGSMVSSFENGGGTLDRGPTVSNLGILSAMASTGVSYQAQLQSKNSFQQAEQAQASRTSAWNAALDASKDYLKSHSAGKSVGTNDDIANVAGFNQASSKMQEAAHIWKSGFDISDSEKFQILSEVSAAGRLGPIGSKIAAGASNTGEAKQLLQSAADYVEKSGFKEEDSKAQNFAHKILAGSTSETGTRATEALRSSLQKAEQASMVVSSSLSSAHAYEQVTSETQSGDARTQTNLSNYIVDQLGGPQRAGAILADHPDNLGQFIQPIVDRYVAEQAASIKHGDAGANAEVGIRAISATPHADPHTLYTEGSGQVKREHKQDNASVPGNPKSGPSVMVDDGPGGEKAQPVSADQLQAAVRAGRAAQETKSNNVHSEVRSAKNTVAGHVQDRQEDPALFSNTSGAAFAAKDPSKNNPAKKPTNIGGADGDW
jgi:conjugal transfer mating pair stabilization protein TraG